MGPKAVSGGRGRHPPGNQGHVLGARPLVHAAYWALLAVVAYLNRAPGGGECSSELQVAGSVGVKQTACPTWSRERVPGGGSKGNTVTSVDPRCFKNPFLDVHTFDTGLSAGLCRRITDAAEKRGAAQGWGSVSDIGVPTHDIYVDQLDLKRPDLLEINAFLLRLRTFVKEQFVDSNSTGRDGAVNTQWAGFDYSETVSLKSLPFVIRYDSATDHRGLMAHKDNADVSFVVLLSDPADFEVAGGGKAATHFEAFGAVPLQQAEAVVMNGQLVHESLPLARGRRYVLSGFTAFSEAYLDMKRRDTLATMAYNH